MRSERMRKALKYLRILIPVAVIAGILLLELLSRSAAMIFNRAMERQDMLRGTVTVERLIADIFGNVQFENLEWTDMNGSQILFVPRGSFKVSLWDVVTRSLKSTTVSELNLDRADISVRLNDKMQVDFVRHSKDFGMMSELSDTPDSEWESKVSLVGKTEDELREIGEASRRRQKLRIERQWSNFNRADRRLRLKLNLNKCNIEVLYRDRHYLLSRMSLSSDIDTNRSMKLRMSAEGFGGTAIGKGMSIEGTIDFAGKDIPEEKMTVNFYEVDPSSLGFGLNIHNTMTLKAYFSGPVSHPVGIGTVEMDDLDIPALKFTKVKGDIKYENANLTFGDVNAKVYGGRLSANGDYNIDTRYYNIYGVGEDLKTKIALPDAKLFCSVNLNLEINSKGGPKEMTSRGSFVSGSGTYRRIPFSSIRGSFSNSYRDLRFYDVVIDLGAYIVTTDALSITDGELTLNPIRLIDDEGRELVTYDPAERPRKD